MYTVPVVVIRSNDHCFLDIIRSCGSEGIPVIPVFFSWEGAGEWLSEKSKYYTNPIRISNPAENEEQAKRELIELGKLLKKKFHTKILIIPSSDTSLVFLQNHFLEFQKYFYQMGHDDFTKDCIRELSKSSFAHFMKEAGICIPHTLDVLCEEDIKPAVSAIEYPCVIKPVTKDIGNSFQRTHNQNKAIECENAAILEKNLHQELKNGYQLIVQEKIFFKTLEDEISIYAYADSSGKIIMLSGLHKLIEYPEKYGTGIVCRQYVREELSTVTESIIRTLKWHGFACIEFMKNCKTGKWTVIEMNLRPWLSIYFQGFLHFNFVAQLYKEIYAKNEFIKEPVISVNNDFIMLDIPLLLRKKIDEQLGVESAIRDVTDYIQSHSGKCVFSHYLAMDIMPGIAEKTMLIQKYGNEQLFEKMYYAMDVNNERLSENLNQVSLKRPLDMKVEYAD